MIFGLLILLGVALFLAIIWGAYQSQRLIHLNAEKAVLQERLQTAQQQLVAAETDQRLKLEQETAKLLETRTEQFTRLAKGDLLRLIEPLSRELETFRKLTSEQQQLATTQYTRFEEQLKQLVLTGQSVGKQADALARALKTENKTQGRWGEMVLERILELSGLEKDRDYRLEVELTDLSGDKIRTETGSKTRPDALVYYPEGKCVVIDAKVSLTAYVEAVENGVADRLVAHVQSVKNHINELASKHYERAPGSLPFVLMFIPNEAAYAAAVTQEPTLWGYAYEQGILLVNPSTLAIALKTIYELRKQEIRVQNAEKLAEQSGALYDKFCGLLQDLTNVRTAIDKAVVALDMAEKKLGTGSGNLIRRVASLRKLGAKTSKQIPASRLDGALESD